MTSKDVAEFGGFKTCKRCREARRRCHSKNKNEYNQARREERAKGSKICEECGLKIRNEKWEVHFHYELHPNSEINLRMKGYLTQLGDLRRQGKLNDKIQAEIKEEYEKPKRVIHKRLNEQFPNRFVDEGETSEPQPEPEKPKPDIDKVFNHVQQLHMNDESLEDYYMLFGKHKDKLVIEIPVDR